MGPGECDTDSRYNPLKAIPDCHDHIFYFEVSLGKGLDNFIRVFGMAPFQERIDASRRDYFWAAAPFCTSLFLQGGWFAPGMILAFPFRKYR